MGEFGFNKEVIVLYYKSMSADASFVKNFMIILV